jgi:dATP pyrophosphohydrolase
VETAGREVFEETGINCGPGTALHAGLRDWGLENIYDIYPRWRHRYAPGVTRNTEHVFGLTVPAGTPVTLNPREHTAYRWLPWRQAADACFSPSNAEAILMLPEFMA